MNLIKLAQLVQDLEDQGFEQEATNLADAITEDTESAEEIINSPLVSEGRAFQLGASLQNRVYWKNGFYSLINFNIGQLKYLGSDNIWREGRFNHQYLLNATVGKEWSGAERKGKLRQFGINARFVARGGFREMSIDFDASSFHGSR